MLVRDDHAQEWVLLNAVLQRRNEGLSQINVYLFTPKLINCRNDKRVVEPEIFATNCAVFIGTCFRVRVTDVLGLGSTNLRSA
jgi:hypothetical protein